MLQLPGRLGRCLPYLGAQSFPPRGWRVCSCSRRRTLSRPSVVAALATSDLEVANAYRSALPARMWPTPCESVYVTASSIALLRYSDAVASRKPPLSITTSIQRSLSALKGASLSTWWRIDIRLKVRESAWTRRTRSMTQLRMPRICVRRTAAGAPCRQELLHSQKRRPADANFNPKNASEKNAKNITPPSIGQLKKRTSFSATDVVWH